LVVLTEKFHGRVLHLLKHSMMHRPEGSADFLFMKPAPKGAKSLLSGSRATRQYLRDLPTECLRLCGIERRVNFMSWRHCCVGMMVESGVGEREAMCFTGHRSATAFRGYIAARIKKKRYAKALKRRHKFEAKLNRGNFCWFK